MFWAVEHSFNEGCQIFLGLFLQVTSGFELYLCFSPLATKAMAVAAVNKLLKWIRKEEDRLFILSPLTYWDPKLYAEPAAPALVTTQAYRASIPFISAN